MLAKLALKHNKTAFQILPYYKLFPCFYLHKFRSKDFLARQKKSFDKNRRVEELAYENKVQIAKKVESKYSDQFTQNESHKVGLNNAEQIEGSAEQSYVINYYVPLADEDYKYLDYFKPELRNVILQGGKLTLANEINNYNLNQSDPAFILSISLNSRGSNE